MDVGGTKGKLGAKYPQFTAVVAVSAPTTASLAAKAKRLLAYLDANPSVDLPRLSYATTSRRAHYRFRCVVSGGTLSEIKNSLRSLVHSEIPTTLLPKPDVAFTFTGQGWCYSTICKELYATPGRFRSDIQRFDSIAQEHGFSSFLPLIDGREPINILGTVVRDLGTTCVQMALVHLWRALGVQPRVVVGHSLGEFAALYSAGVISAEDAIFLVGTRATLLELRCTPNTHTLLAVNAKPSKIFVGQDPRLEVAYLNGPKATVIGGRSGDIDLLASDLVDRGIKHAKFHMDYAFHTSQVEPMLEEFKAAAKRVAFHQPKLPLVSPLNGLVVTDKGTFDAEYVSRHCRLPVNFHGGIEEAVRTGHTSPETIFVEIGGHPECSEMITASVGRNVTAVASLRRHEDPLKAFAEAICVLYKKGLDIEWNEYHRNFSLGSHQVSAPCMRLVAEGLRRQLRQLQLRSKVSTSRQQNALGDLPRRVARMKRRIL